MIEFDRLTTEHWTIAFPSSWVDGSAEDGTTYFESAEGDKGFYVSLWVMSAQEPRSAKQLVETFQATEMESFFPEDEKWEVSHRTVEEHENYAVGYWEGINAAREYRIAGKQLAAGNIVVRATFHDYACVTRDISAEFFAPIVESLQLCEP